ncbi:SDR family oxidoreductase [Amycolatopsis sp. WAC 01376]|uniref:SDR family oxidoreductase n=1 Tax=Amycolatopsis sp. WAC 01376 TaxID=2203195 RepID=UPI0018F35DFE|nr:SDR family oxidoreductase [Amycolatopsis sp. WAC 01376]
MTRTHKTTTTLYNQPPRRFIPGRPASGEPDRTGPQTRAATAGKDQDDSRFLAAEFGERGARVVSVSPGSFDTAMGRLEENHGAGDLVKSAAIKRFGRPEEVASVLAFCAGEAPGYLTGVDILVDGGTKARKEFS